MFPIRIHSHRQRTGTKKRGYGKIHSPEIRNMWRRHNNLRKTALQRHFIRALSYDNNIHPAGKAFNNVVSSFINNLSGSVIHFNHPVVRNTLNHYPAVIGHNLNSILTVQNFTYAAEIIFIHIYKVAPHGGCPVIANRPLRHGQNTIRVMIVFKRVLRYFRRRRILRPYFSQTAASCKNIVAD